jgi:hypothetical protein
MRLMEYMTQYPDEVKRYKSRLFDFNRIFTVLEMNEGDVYIETETVDDNGVTTVEVLRNSKAHNERGHFTLIWRERFGENYSSMQSYARDAQYPIYSVVNLDAIHS